MSLVWNSRGTAMGNGWDSHRTPIKVLELAHGFPVGLPVHSDGLIVMACGTPHGSAVRRCWVPQRMPTGSNYCCGTPTERAWYPDCGYGKKLTFGALLSSRSGSLAGVTTLFFRGLNPFRASIMFPLLTPRNL